MAKFLLKIWQINSSMTEDVLRPNCPCCGRASGDYEWGMLSAFLSTRALTRPAQPVKLLRCTQCGLRWSERGLSDVEASRLYQDYRGEAYFQERHHFEPWYGKKLNESLGAAGAFLARRAVVLEVLRNAGVPEKLGRVLDHGGDRGQLLLAMDAAERELFDFSMKEMEPGVSRVNSLDGVACRYDLTLSCHVLEHVNEPLEVLMTLARVTKPGGYVFVELPLEPWSVTTFASSRLAQWWGWALAKSPPLLQAIDFLSTGMRLKTGWIPPFGFSFVREHINWFCETSLNRLLINAGLNVLHCGRNSAGTLCAVAVKPR